MPAATVSGRIYLEVPFAQKDEANALGATYDPERKLWYASAASDLSRFQKWPLALTELPGENRNFGNDPGAPLFVDLIPSTSWFTNVRSCVEKKDWDRLRRFIYKRAGYRCEVCGENTPLDCHERWSYDEARYVQKLERLIGLCKACHMASHMGFSDYIGIGEKSRAHLKRINGWSDSDIELHIEAATEQWMYRSAFSWTLDLSILENAGIEIAKPTSDEKVEAEVYFD